MEEYRNPDERAARALERIANSSECIAVWIVLAVIVGTVLTAMVVAALTK